MYKGWWRGFIIFLSLALAFAMLMFLCLGSRIGNAIIQFSKVLKTFAILGYKRHIQPSCLPVILFSKDSSLFFEWPTLKPRVESSNVHSVAVKLFPFGSLSAKPLMLKGTFPGLPLLRSAWNHYQMFSAHLFQRTDGESQVPCFTNASDSHFYPAGRSTCALLRCARNVSFFWRSWRPKKQRHRDSNKVTTKNSLHKGINPKSSSFKCQC